ncbi:right-handed parallel beta-helix repeat-containing protein (plasmid) [Haloferacaceae archaeon DSL9]
MAKINLADRGLEPGDLIDPYLCDYFGSGDAVICPPGEYEWNGRGFDQPSAGSRFIGAGAENTTLRTTGNAETIAFRHGSGDVLLQGFRIDGVHAKNRKFSFYPECGRDARITFRDVRCPDGLSGDHRSRWFYGARNALEGRLVLENCLFSLAGNNCLYLDKAPDPSESRSGITIDKCVFKNSTVSLVRIGNGTDEIRNSLFIIDTNDIPRGNNTNGLRIRSSGGEFVCENCEFYYHERADRCSGSPIQIREEADDITGFIRDCRIYNGTSAAAVSTRGRAGRNIVLENLHVTGPGNCTIGSNVKRENVCVGSECVQPRWTEKGVLTRGVDNPFKER